jgi:hypothetical protein
VQLTGCAFFAMRDENDNSGEEQQPREPIEIQAVAGTTTKRRGESAEAEFISRAITLGFSVLQPWGDSDRYDVVIDHGQGFSRVQVKSAASCNRGQYSMKAGGLSKRYTNQDIDFLAGLVVPENLWYIVPIDAFAGVQALHFNPHPGQRKSKYEKYLEAWCLLDCTREARGWKDIPAVCRCQQLAVRCAVCPLRG